MKQVFTIYHRKNYFFAMISCMVCSFLLNISVFGQSESRVKQELFYSDALQLKLIYNIYLPEGYGDNNERYPVVYFLSSRGHEWFNKYLPGREGHSLKDIADELISEGRIGKMILVSLPAGYCNLAIPGMPNMLRPDLTPPNLVGTGRFEDYLINDLIPHIDATYLTLPDRDHRGVDGYDMAGYAAILSGLKHPGLFSSVGSYDANIMWQNLDDPTIPETKADDTFWLGSKSDSIVGPTFDVPRNIDYLLKNSAVDLLVKADNSNLKSIQETRFHIQASNPHNLDYYEMSKTGGRLGRNLQFIRALEAKGNYNSFNDMSPEPGSKHDFANADLHASQSLIKHWQTFKDMPTSVNEGSLTPETPYLSQNYPNPFNPTTNIQYSIPYSNYVSLKVYDILGKEVLTLVNGYKAEGNYEVEVDGSRLASGVYIYKLQSGNFVETRKLTLLR